MPWKKILGANNRESVSTRKTCDAIHPSMVNQSYKVHCIIAVILRGSETSQYPIFKINRDVVSSGERKRYR